MISVGPVSCRHWMFCDILVPVSCECGTRRKAFIVKKHPPKSADKMALPLVNKNGCKSQEADDALRCLSQAQGQYQEKPKLPYIPGSEVSGVVTEIGEQCCKARECH